MPGDPGDHAGRDRQRLRQPLQRRPQPVVEDAGPQAMGDLPELGDRGGQLGDGLVEDLAGAGGVMAEAAA